MLQAVKKKIRDSVRQFAKNISKEEKKNFGTVGFVFCDDVFIKEHNRKYLGHDYATDIITFYDTDEEGKTEGELLISVDTVKSNSQRFKTGFENELMRVVVHGLLHLCGYDDSTPAEKKIIRKKENYYLKHIL